MDRVPQDQKDQAGNQYDHSKKFLTEEYFPEERRDQFIYRAKKVIVECQQHDDYQSAIRWLLSALEEYNGHAQTVAAKESAASGSLSEDPSLTTAFSELKTLLERFANGKSLDEVKQRADAVYQAATDDEELRNWFKRLNAYARKVC